ncbi:hypothetical protein RRG08_051731 [Elysia crispata]|uniref:Uncharacterized protein n=1 Tax=Elysia crispata TaxID=231223 RepID=A0AAE1BCG7_9GAST|nr:hypothetical protein RRG08_051731 [Elysia crispata]
MTSLTQPCHQARVKLGHHPLSHAISPIQPGLTCLDTCGHLPPLTNVRTNRCECPPLTLLATGSSLPLCLLTVLASCAGLSPSYIPTQLS